MYPPEILRDSITSSVFSSGELPEPFGETSYIALVEHYAQTALRKKTQGADRITLRGMSSLTDARVAVLGARSAGLPVTVSLSAEQEGRLIEPEECLAALICLQELGIAAFGLDFTQVTAEILELYATIAPYATVRLCARPKAGANADKFAALLQAGVTLLCVAQDDAGQTAAAGRAISKSGPVTCPPRPEDAPILLCNEWGVFYLEEDFTVSDEIECSYDMSEVLLDRANQAFDALCFCVQNIDDAQNLGRNYHLSQNATCILAESEESLEMALALYNGRALVDSRSDVAESAMELLAGAYGAIVR